MTLTVPQYTTDIFSQEAILDPFPHYRAIRDLGPVVWLPDASVHAVGRYHDVRAVLADHEHFISGEGVGFDATNNEITRGTTIASDPPVHDHLRQVVAHRLTPRALREQRAAIEVKADELVQRMLTRDVVDAVPEIAEAMPMSVVPDFLGFPDDCRDRLLSWASAVVDLGGPPSDRTPAALGQAGELVGYASGLVQERRVLPGSLGADLLEAADRGEVSLEQCPALLLDYFGPSLETTVSALGSALALFSQHPDQWELLRADPSLIGGAFNEVVRLESPLRAFTRVAVEGAEIDGIAVPAGTRVGVFYASANRDERKWDRPDEFDITRDNADHLGLGYGVHGCAGQGLARLEIGAVLTRLAESVVRLEPAGRPVRAVSSLLRGYTSLPLRLHTS